MNYFAVIQLLGFAFLMVAAGCDTTNRQASRSPAPCPEPVVCEIDGQPVNQRDFLNHLYNPRAREILDEIIMTRVVRQAAATRGIIPDAALMQQEYQQTLELLAPDKPRHQQEALFNYMLERRQLERATFDLILERQALLKQMIDPVIEITKERLQTEFEKQYGRRVVVRQLMVSSFRQMTQARQRLEAGEDFTKVIMDMSEDQVSLATQGQVGPFSHADADFPELVRQHAFALQNSGDMSEPFSIYDANNREWWYLLQLVRVYDPELVTLEQTREELERIIRYQTIQERTLHLQQELRDKARVTIRDGRLLLTRPVGDENTPSTRQQ